MIDTGDIDIMVTNLVQKVETRKEAEEVVKLLLQKFSSQTAFEGVLDEAAFAKQTVQEVWKRKVTNLFSSLKTRRG